MILTDEQSRFLAEFLEQNRGAGFETRKVGAWHFCYDPEPADRLATLVLKGVKTATSSAYWGYDADPDSVPRPGNLSIITFYSGMPACLIETVRTTIVPYRDVGTDFARKEGEGDRSLRYWRSVHREFFSRELENYGLRFSQTMLVLCEEFRLLHSAALDPATRAFQGQPDGVSSPSPNTAASKR